MRKRRYASCVECGGRTTGQCFGCGSPLHIYDCANKLGECNECIDRRAAAEDRDAAERECSKDCQADALERWVDGTEQD